MTPSNLITLASCCIRLGDKDLLKGILGNAGWDDPSLVDIRKLSRILVGELPVEDAKTLPHEYRMMFDDFKGGFCHEPA